MTPVPATWSTIGSTCHEANVRYCVCPLWAVFKSRPHPADHWLTFSQPTHPPTLGLSPMLSVLPNCSQSVSYGLTLFLAHIIYSNLKMEVTWFSKTSVHNKHTQWHIPEDGIRIECHE
jgi:hypothetical protein